MRIILFASTESDHLNMDVLALRELRGYGAVTVFEMARPDYRGQGIAQSPQSVKHWLAVEMIEGAAIVLHPDTEPADAVELARVAAFLEAPCLPMSQLPDLPPEGEEAIELFRTEFTGLNGSVVRRSAVERAVVGCQAADTASDAASAQRAGAVAGFGAGSPDNRQPTTDNARLAPTDNRPGPFTIPQAEVDDEGNIIDRPRTPREWMRDQLLRFRRWEERFNARYGSLLKNPVSRALREGMTAPPPATTMPPREYKLHTSKPLTTG